MLFVSKWRHGRKWTGERSGENLYVLFEYLRRTDVLCGRSCGILMYILSSGPDVGLYSNFMYSTNWYQLSWSLFSRRNR
jgi:hypothetical protein